MDEDKNLIEFLETLTKMNENNIKFMIDNHAEIPITKNMYKYLKEIVEVQRVINSFDFVKTPNKEIENG